MPDTVPGLGFGSKQDGNEIALAIWQFGNEQDGKQDGNQTPCPSGAFIEVTGDRQQARKQVGNFQVVIWDQNKMG